MVDKTEIKGLGFKEALKNPAVYYMVVAVSVMWVFVYQFILNTDKQGVNCEADKTELRKELADVRGKNEALVTALLIKNGIILQQEIEKKELDSTIKEKVGIPSKQIIKDK